MRSNLYRKEFTNQDQLQMFKTIMLISTVIIDPQQAVEMANNGVEFCEAGYVDNNQMLTTLSDISKWHQWMLLYILKMLCLTSWKIYPFLKLILYNIDWMHLKIY